MNMINLKAAFRSLSNSKLQSIISVIGLCSRKGIRHTGNHHSYRKLAKLESRFQKPGRVIEI